MSKLIIYTQVEIQQIKLAARIASQVLDLITPHVIAGVTTEHLNNLCHHYIEEQQNKLR